MFDVIIIGGGPAGLTAAVYACRKGLEVLLVTRDIGGQIAKTPEVENFPGFDLISGTDLSMKLLNQAKKFGATVKFEETKKIKINPDKTFKINTIKNEYQGKSIIIAMGKKPRELGVIGEERLKGHGVSYCSICDAPFFKGKTISIIGGGNSALEAAASSSKIAKKTYIVHRLDKFQGEAVMAKRVMDDDKIEKIFNAEVAEIIGSDKVEKIKFKDGKEIATDAVIVEIGYVIDTSLIQGLVELDDSNQIVVNLRQETNVDGIFGAGDITNSAYKQAIIASGDGAKAALSAFDYLEKQNGKRGICNEKRCHTSI